MNINVSTLLFLGLLCLGLLSSTGLADQLPKQDSRVNALNNKTSSQQTIKTNKIVPVKSSKNTSEPPPRPVYTPPFLGAPDSNRLVGMAVRGLSHDNLLLTVLTPEHTGITSQPQPVLYWYLSKPLDQSYQVIEFVLTSETSVAPILRKNIDPPTTSGLQKISLADDNIYLDSGVEYTWSIALVKNVKSRSLDIVSSGNVKYVEASTEFQTRIKQSAVDQRPFVYAESGLWYESIADLLEQIELQPQNKRLPHNLMALLEQAGLEQVAVHLHHDLLDRSNTNTDK